VIRVSLVPLLRVLILYMLFLSLCLKCFETVLWCIIILVLVLGLWLLEDSQKEGVVDVVLISSLSFKRGVLIFIFSEFIFFLRMLVSAIYLVESGWDPSWLGVDFYGAPLIISVVLLSSGIRLTYAHSKLIIGQGGHYGLLATILLGGMFFIVQVQEWEDNIFRLITRVGGRVFYMITGFHGLHVLIGFILNLLLLL